MAYKTLVNVAVVVTTAITALGLQEASGQCEAQKITAPDPGVQSEFGGSLSTDGDVLVIGAVLDDGFGSAYVYRRTGQTYEFEQKLTASDSGEGEWEQVQKLTASDAVLDGTFGFSMSVDGDVLAVGAIGAAGNCAGGGG